MKTFAEIVSEITPEKIAEIERIRANIDRKIFANIPLTNDEMHFECEQRPWAIKSTIPYCEDEFFREFLLKNDPQQVLYDELSTDNYFQFGAILIQWDLLMKKGNLEDPDIKAERIEFRYELSQLKKQVMKDSPEFNYRYIKLLEWSKYRNIAVKRIFRTKIRKDKYVLFLNDQEIIYNYQSLTHIIARHFALGMKAYFTDRDHFYGVFLPDDLHTWFEQFLTLINGSELYSKDSIREINFRYLNKNYRINTKIETFFELGKTGMQTRNVITTFFHLSKAQELDKLANTYTLNKATDQFSFYTLK